MNRSYKWYVFQPIIVKTNSFSKCSPSLAVICHLYNNNSFTGIRPEIFQIRLQFHTKVTTLTSMVHTLWALFCIALQTDSGNWMPCPTHPTRQKKTGKPPWNPESARKSHNEHDRRRHNGSNTTTSPVQAIGTIYALPKPYWKQNKNTRTSVKYDEECHPALCMTERERMAPLAFPLTSSK